MVRLSIVVLGLGLLAACKFDPNPIGGGGGDSGPTRDAPDKDAELGTEAANPEASVPVTADFPITTDTYVDSLNQTTSFGDAVAVLADGASTPATILMRAELGAITPAATITKAELHIWTSNDAGGPCDVVELLESWDEDNATWTQRAAGLPWSGGAGAAPPSRGTAGIAPQLPIAAMFTEDVVDLDLTVVTKWVAQPETNFGFAITVNSANGANFRSREHTTVDNRPFLRITH